jgi:hypothetical protein
MLRGAKEQWRKRLSAHAQSGQTVTAWCRLNNLNVSTFYAWRNRLAVAANAQRLVPLRVVESVPEVSQALDLVLSFSGAQLRLPRDVAPRWLADVLLGLR